LICGGEAHLFRLLCLNLLERGFELVVAVAEVVEAVGDQGGRLELTLVLESVRELVQLVGMVAVVLYHIGEQSDRLFDVATIFMAVVGMSFVHPEVPPCVVLWRICPPPMEL